MIYFVTDGENVKIGYTNGNLAQRLSQIQTGNPKRLKVLGTMEGGKQKERELHQQWSGARRSGEWFSLTDDMLKWIETHSSRTVPANKSPANRAKATVNIQDVRRAIKMAENEEHLELSLLPTHLIVAAADKISYQADEIEHLAKEIRKVSENRYRKAMMTACSYYRPLPALAIILEGRDKAQRNGPWEIDTPGWVVMDDEERFLGWGATWLTVTGFLEKLSSFYLEMDFYRGMDKSRIERIKEAAWRYGYVFDGNFTLWWKPSFRSNPTLGQIDENVFPPNTED